MVSVLAIDIFATRPRKGTLLCKCRYCGDLFMLPKCRVIKLGMGLVCKRCCGASVAEKFWRRVDKSGNCWLWMGSRHPQGHGYASFEGRVQYAHRVSWQLTNGPIPDGLFVCHHCDNPPCVNPAHLFLGTASDNNWDRARKGRSGITGKLSDDDIKEIRLLLSRRELSQREIGILFGVSRSAIENIAIGRPRRLVPLSLSGSKSSSSSSSSQGSHGHIGSDRMESGNLW